DRGEPRGGARGDVERQTSKARVSNGIVEAQNSNEKSTSVEDRGEPRVGARGDVERQVLEACESDTVEVRQLSRKSTRTMEANINGFKAHSFLKDYNDDKGFSHGSEFNRKLVSKFMLRYQSKGATANLFPFHGAKELKARLKWVRRNSFDYSMAAIIVMNAIYLGNQTAWVLHTVLEQGDIDNGRRWFWLAGDIAFALVFFLELTLRIFAYQVKFFTGSQRWWNAFDCFTMFATIVAVLLDLFRAPDSFGVDLLKVVRLARMVRT
ncbi:unnamed protein product, partial [Prorocentrum cordatum]